MAEGAKGGQMLPPPPVPPPGLGAAIRYGEIQLDRGDDSAVIEGIISGNINLPQQRQETLALTEASRQARELQEAALARIEERRRMQAQVVPTGAPEVKHLLRQLREPVTLFGERPEDRRERLRKLMAAMGDSAVQAIRAGDTVVMDEAPVQAELFYTEGPPELEETRRQVAAFSLARAQARVGEAKRRRLTPDAERGAFQEAAEVARSTANSASEVAGERPLCACAISPDGAVVAVGGSTGALCWHRARDLRRLRTARPAQDRITGIAWHPSAASGEGADGEESRALALIVGSTDSLVRLHSSTGALLGTLRGHTARLGRVAAHPLGALLGSASWDGTWRLWDGATGACLAEQEGHARAVHALAFQGDGALAGSGGLDAIGRVWDMRTGRSIMVLEGHVDGILALGFSPNGFQVVTGAQDNTARVWDLRQQRSLYSLPGHSKQLSQVMYEPTSGHTLMTAGYDRTVKLWSALDFSLLRSLAGHEGHVMDAAFSPASPGLIATVSYDRTLKTWEPQAVSMQS